MTERSASSSVGNPASTLKGEWRSLAVRHEVWNPCLKRQPEMLEHSLAPVVNPLFEHLGPLAHQIHWNEIPLEEIEDGHRVESDRHLRVAVNLHRVDGRQAAGDHCPHRVHVEVAEVEPVRPRLVESR